jgi:hypothetical protein
MLKEAAVDAYKALYRYLPGEPEENHKSFIRIDDTLREI